MTFKEIFEKYFLLFAVFITGAAVLIIEVSAIRVLSPYFGNTIFSVSSVITVILLALSFGYYAGGIVSDKNPSLKIFLYIIFGSGLVLFFLNFLSENILPVFNSMFSFSLGPLISSFVLFFLPAFLLGMLSPFAITLSSLNAKMGEIGKISGKIFFWSTLGSITGSLAAGFFLIPFFGISYILNSVALVLLCLGLIPAFFLGYIERKPVNLLILLIFFLPLLSFLPYQDNKNIVYKKDGVYEKITIYDDMYQGRKARFLIQDKSLSAATFLDGANPNDLAFNYTKYYQLYQLFNPHINNVLVIGGGAYSIPKALSYEKPNAVIDVAEIEPSLLNLSKQYFFLPATDNINTYPEDGRRFLEKSDKKYDFIFSDAYHSIYSIPFHLTTKEFFQVAKNKLNDKGLFVANIIGDLSRQNDSFVLSEMKTFKEVFDNSYFFAVDAPNSTKAQNIIFVGFNSNKKIDVGNPSIKASNNEIISKLSEKEISVDRFEFSPYQVLTDNFAPVEYMIGKLLGNISQYTDKVNGKEILALLAQELRYGLRYIASPGHEKTADFLVQELQGISDHVQVQTWNKIAGNGNIFQLKNIIARINPDEKNRIILGTHYDATKATPGANNSASGTAVLVELLRNLKDTGVKLPIGIDVVFFDGEEGEEMQGGNSVHWVPLGSTYFANHLFELYPDEKPKEAIIVDMVCDKNLNILKEPYSLQADQQGVQDFWNIARKINKNAFLNKTGYAIEDDHTPLIKAGIKSFLLIDFDYPYIYTTQDTLDKCSPDSLSTIANALKNYIMTVSF